MRRSRFLAALASLALLFGSAAWWLSQEEPALESAERAAPAKQVDPSRSVEQLELAAPGGAPRDPARAASGADRELVPTGLAETSTIEPPPPDLRGRIVVIEPDGTEITNAFGSLTWTRWVGVAPSFHQVAVANGEFVVPAASLVGLRAVSFKSLRLGLKNALIETPRGLHMPPFDDPFELRARLLATASLRVIDAASGADLEGVVIVTTSGSSGRRRHPGIGYESSILARGLRSPIFLEEPLFSRHRFGSFGSDDVLVGAPGFAWTRAEIDINRDGEQVAALERGADLALHVRGCAPAARAHLRLRKGGETHGELYAEVGLHADGSLRFSGLPNGALRASAELGSHYESIDLGTVELELRVGELTEGTLELSPAPPLQLADASGVVLVPMAWKADPPSLRLRFEGVAFGGVEGMRRVSTKEVPSALQGFDAFSWSETGLQVGSYVLDVIELGYATTLELPLGGLAGFEIALPLPSELLVHIVDGATGSPVEAASLRWMLKHGDSFVQPSRSIESDATGLARVLAPASPIHLTVSADAYRRHREGVDLTLGPRELTVRLQKACGFTLRLTCGGRPIAPSRDWTRHAVRALQVESVLTSTDEGACTIGLRDAGTFSFSLPEIPGFESVPTQTVVVLPGQFTEHVIELTRRR